MKKLWPHKAQSNAVQCVFAKAQSSLIVNTRFWYQHGQTLSTLCFTKLDISMKIQIKQQLENCSLRSCQGSWRKLLKWKQKNLVWNWMKYNSLNEFILDEILWMNFSGFSILHCFGKKNQKNCQKLENSQKCVFVFRHQLTEVPESAMLRFQMTQVTIGLLDFALDLKGKEHYCEFYKR